MIRVILPAHLRALARVSGSHSSPPVRLRYTRSFPSSGTCRESLVIGTT